MGDTEYFLHFILVLLDGAKYSSDVHTAYTNQYGGQYGRGRSFILEGGIQSVYQYLRYTWRTLETFDNTTMDKRGLIIR